MRCSVVADLRSLQTLRRKLEATQARSLKGSRALQAQPRVVNHGHGTRSECSSPWLASVVDKAGMGPAGFHGLRSHLILICRSFS